MRTTLTIDDDIAIRLAEIRSEEGARFKTLLNHVLRAGLAALQSADCRKPKKTFSTKTYRATCLLPETITSTQDMLAFAEGESWK